jgi:hypothetical protein
MKSILDRDLQRRDREDFEGAREEVDPVERDNRSISSDREWTMDLEISVDATEFSR